MQIDNTREKIIQNLRDRNCDDTIIEVFKSVIPFDKVEAFYREYLK